MGKRKSSKGNPWHRLDNGQFTTAGDVALNRFYGIESDIKSYINNPAFGSQKPKDQQIRNTNIDNALYDGGYIESKPTIKKYFDSIDEAEIFVNTITFSHHEEEAWKNHKDLVSTYLNVARGYAERNEFSVVCDEGYYSETDTRREASQTMRDYGWTNDDVRKLLMEMNANDFLNSGENLSFDENNRGTVVMVFSPQIVAKNRLTGEWEVTDLYIKTCLNPHPNKKLGRKEMQVISVREVTRDDVCIFTGDKRQAGRRKYEV